MWLIHISFILIFQRFLMPAVFSAIVLPELLVRDGGVQIPLTNLRLVAGLMAAVIALKTRNILVTIVSGMLILWLLQYAVSFFQ